MIGHYNFRFKNYLVLGFCAERHIPCTCQSFLDKLNLRWVPEKSRNNQPKFSRKKYCVHWNIFQGLNEWNIVKLCQTSTSVGEFQKVKCSIRHQHLKDITNNIKIGDIAAHNVDAKNTNGFYFIEIEFSTIHFIVKWWNRL